MTKASKAAPAPPGYEQLERALASFDAGESGRWVANKLNGCPVQGIDRAVRLLRARGREREGRAVLDEILAKMAGPPDGRGLTWWRHDAEAMQPGGSGDDGMVAPGWQRQMSDFVEHDPNA